jgi:hypothetical protein
MYFSHSRTSLSLHLFEISHSWPFLVAAPVFQAIGSGPLYSLNTTTSEVKLIGFQILAGISVSFRMQNSLLAMQ